MKTYYIYKHTRLDINEVFYIGFGTKREKATGSTLRCLYDRAFSTKGRNPYWHNIVNRTPYSVDIIFESTDKNEVLNKEIELIAEFKRKIDGGKLSNLSSGGDCGRTKLSELGKKNFRKSIGTKVEQYTINGEFLAEYDSVIEAQEKTQVNQKGIFNCIYNRVKTAGGFKWRKKEV